MRIGDLILAQMEDLDYRIISANHNVIWDDKASRMPQVFHSCQVKYIKPRHNGFIIWLGGD